MRRDFIPVDRIFEYLFVHMSVLTDHFLFLLILVITQTDDSSQYLVGRVSDPPVK